MKNIGKRALSLLVVLALFIGCFSVFLWNYAQKGEDWASFPSNGHLYKDGSLKSAGTIYDAAGRVLAETKDGERKYSTDSAIRKATLHALGDKEGFIAGGVQSIYGATLTGYSKIFGVYGPDGNIISEDITLTLDANVCKAALAALNGRKGTVGVIDYKTGEIICMVSTPTFDPENKPKIDEENIEKNGGIYVNRLTMGKFAPGSTFKIITAAAAIENLPGVENRIFECPGELVLGPDKITCPQKHGKINLSQAMSVSCNCTFGSLALEIGRDKLEKKAEQMGFNQNVSFGRQNFAKSSIDLSKAENANLAWAGIGQYTDLANPGHMMTLMAALANGGSVKTPTLVAYTKNKNGKITDMHSEGKLQLSNPGECLAVAKLMRYSVKNNYGDSKFKGLEVCAKSGTAEVEKGKNPHAWFVGFTQNEKYPFAFVVLVENGGSGSGVGAPIASTVLKAAALAYDEKK